MGAHRPYCDYETGDVCWCPQGLIEQVYGQKKSDLNTGANTAASKSSASYVGSTMPRKTGKIPTTPRKPKTSGTVAYGGQVEHDH